MYSHFKLEVRMKQLTSQACEAFSLSISINAWISWVHFSMFLWIIVQFLRNILHWLDVAKFQSQSISWKRIYSSHEYWWLERLYWVFIDSFMTHSVEIPKALLTLSPILIASAILVLHLITQKLFDFQIRIVNKAFVQLSNYLLQ